MEREREICRDFFGLFVVHYLKNMHEMLLFLPFLPLNLFFFFVKMMMTMSFYAELFYVHFFLDQKINDFHSPSSDYVTLLPSRHYSTLKLNVEMTVIVILLRFLLQLFLYECIPKVGM